MSEMKHSDRSNPDLLQYPPGAALTGDGSPHKEQPSNKFGCRGQCNRQLHTTWPRPMETCDETHFPAFEPCPQAAARVSFAHGHQGRPQDPQRASRTGPQAPERLTRPRHNRTRHMAPPEVPPKRNGNPAVPLRLEVLKKRADFLAAARGRRQAMPGFHLQAHQVGGAAVRVGFTCSKKVGNAVQRNRAKRRLRALARVVLPRHGRPGWDYVLVGRHEATANVAFQDMVADLENALEKAHGA